MISEQAIVDKSAILESSVEVGPFSIIGKEVEIGKNVKIQSHVVITGNTSISDNCDIYSFASIGSTPQDLKFKGEKTKLIIGKKNKITRICYNKPWNRAWGWSYNCR
jgi:UDP-N-acetylglucosamine acyltransferase